MKKNHYKMGKIKTVKTIKTLAHTDNKNKCK